MATYLRRLVLRSLGEDGVQQGDPLNQHLCATNFDTVAHVVRMLDKKKNARTQELLSGHSKDKGQ